MEDTFILGDVSVKVLSKDKSAKAFWQFTRFSTRTNFSSYLDERGMAYERTLKSTIEARGAVQV